MAAAKKAASKSKAKNKASQRRNKTPSKIAQTPGRAYWTGVLRLSLVSIPIQLFPAVREAAKISFHQVHAPSGKRIRYEKVVPGIGPVDTDDIVKGFEVEKGQYVLLETEEIDNIKLAAKRSIDLVQFVNATEIDPIYFERPFLVAPSEAESEEAYTVMHDALKKTGKVGLGQIVIRGKSSLVALKPCGRGLILETLRYTEEVRKCDPFFSDLTQIKPDKELVELAEELIERKTKPFDPTAFHDAYSDALRELIDAKLEDRPPTQIGEEELGENVIDLMEALRRSVKKPANENVASPQRSPQKTKKPARKRA